MSQHEPSGLCPRLPRLARALLGGISLVVLCSSVKAEPTALEGSWRGLSALTFVWGTKEQARCRADYSRTAETTYTVKAVCTTASATASQTAVLRMVRENTYIGNFHNSTYNVSGTIRVVIRGSKQDVRLISDGASASLTLTRLQDASIAAEAPTLSRPR